MTLDDVTIPNVRLRGTRLTWIEVNNALEFLAGQLLNAYSTPIRVYGIPRGGQIIAGLLQRFDGIACVDSWKDAHCLVDDIIDSGRTRSLWARETNLEVHALITKARDQDWIIFPWEQDDDESAETAIRRLLEHLNLDVASDGMRDTPNRLARLLEDMTSGNFEDIETMLGRTFVTNTDEIIVVRDIPFWSLCEHHLMPFRGHVSVGYLPGSQGRVLGLSKIPRLVKAFALRPQIQERLTDDIARALMNASELKPRGVGVLVRAEHACMSMRGVESEGQMVTSSVLGMFRSDATVKAEWLRLLG